MITGKKVSCFCRVIKFLCGLMLCSTLFAQDAEELRKYTTKLTETPRVSGSDECNKAADYIKTELDNIYSVELQRFTYRGWTAANVLAIKPGGSKVIVVGAHYDSVANCPGADDNASGTAAVIGLAKRLSKIKTRHTLCFQLYAGEEQYLIGSQFYVSNPKWPIKDHIFMLNLDMIGYLKQAPAQPILDDLLKPLNEKYSFAKAITKRESPDSDQASFAKEKLPVIFLTTGLHRHYHKRTDTADRLNYKGIEEICNYAYDLIISVDKHDIPRYNFIESIPVERLLR